MDSAKCKWNTQNVSRIRKCRWNPQILFAESANVSRFRKLYVSSAFLFITELAYEQLKARDGIFDLISIGKRNLNAKEFIHLSAESKNESYNIG